MRSSSQSALKTLGLGLLLALSSVRLQAQVLPTAPNVLSTRAPVVEWGMLPAKQVLTSKTVSGEDPDRRDARVNVSGIKGTLNRDDVHQAMEARQRELNGCVQQTRRGAGWVSGALQFAFKVDAQGRVIQMRSLGSSIGHYALEQCITQVLSETQFPAPSGRATAEFKWGMNVDSGRGSGLKQERNRSVAASVRKHRKALWKQCEVPRRARYKVTAYVSSTGQVISAGAVTKPGPFEEKVPCLIEELSKLQLPKQKHMAKVEFDLR